jgi:Tfp pilus assembly protein PilF
MVRATQGVVLGLTLALPPSLPAAWQAAPPPGVADADVALGIRHVDEGDYDAAILVLDAAARRLAQQKAPSHVLSQAYLYLGVAYLAKGHETSAKARFRDALGQVRDLQVTPESFAPRVVEMFEKAREEMRSAAPAVPEARPTAVAAPPPAKKGGSGKVLLIGGGLLAAGGIAAAAGGGGGGTDSDTPGGGGLRQTSFPNEVVHAGGGRDFVVTATGTGTMTARVTYSPAGVQLGMYAVALSSAQQVLAEGGQSGTTELTLTLPVTAQAYRIAVTHSSGQGPQVDATFTLSVTHP